MIREMISLSTVGFTWGNKFKMGRFFNNYTEKYQEFKAKISLKTICDVVFFL